MKRGFSFFAVFLVALFVVCTNVEAAKKMVAVAGITYNGSGAQQLAANEFHSALETALVNSGAFTVVERGRLGAVLRELGLQQTGLIDGNSAVEMGRMSGAELTVTGNVVGATVGLVDNVLYQTIKAKAQFTFKIIDNKTGVIKVQENVEGNKSIPNTDYYDAKMLLSGAVKEAVEKVVEKLIELNPMSGSVMKVAGENVYVNLGSEQGIRVGDFFLVYKEGEPLMDPMGNILGVAEEEIARARVVDVKPNYCVLKAKKMKGALSNRCKARKVAKK